MPGPSEFGRSIGRFERGVDRLVKALEKSTGGKAGSGGATSRALTLASSARQRTLSGGGAAGLAARGLGAAAGLARGAAGGALALGGAGAVNVGRGGTFAGGASTAAISALASIPFLGELGGFAGTERIQGGALGRLQALTEDVARFGGKDAVSDETRKFIGQKFVAQEQNVETDRNRNKALIADLGVDAAQGQGVIPAAAALAEAFRDLEGFVRQIIGGGGGPGRHT